MPGAAVELHEREEINRALIVDPADVARILWMGLTHPGHRLRCAG